ncbi:MAG: FGGY family carbohydrate kinase [Gaiella sp.]|nr:FGGY family carbohydrate kinase [Gaiella sp.]
MSREPATVLALDLGSSSVRALVLDERLDADPARLARQPVAAVHRAGGAAELDPGRVVEAVVQCLDDLHGRGLLGGVGGVVTASQWHSLLAVDRDGTPLSPALTWADTRATAGGSGPADPDAFHRRTGCWHAPLFWTTRIPWLRAVLDGRVARFLGLSDFVAEALLGEACVSASLASGTGLLDLERLVWDAEALELAGATEAELPVLAAAGWTGTLAPAWRRRWPALAEVPWWPAVGDGAAANVGSGCDRPERVAITVGTSAAVRVVERRDVAAPLPSSLWRYVVDETRVVTGAAFSGAGNLFGWATTVLRIEPGELDAVAPGRHELSALPFHAGARPPQDAAPSAGAIAGLRLDTTAAELCAGLLEGACLEIARGVRAVGATLDARPEHVLSGGAAAASRWWQRTFAATLGEPVLVCDVPEAAARGAALLALGRSGDPPLRAVAPEPGDVAAMEASRERYDDLRARVSGWRAA